MNYWVIVNLLFLLYNADHSVRQQLGKSGFVEIGPTKEWMFLPGEKRDIVLVFKIKDGYHIQADQVLEDHLIPTSLSIKTPEEMVVSSPVFPDPFPFHLKNVSQKMEVFHKELEVRIPLAVSEGTTHGKYLINGNLHYQACDSLKCYFPRDFPFNINIEVVKVNN